MDNPGNITPPRQESKIVIVFDGPNSTLLNVSYDNVSPLQVELAAFVLHRSAKQAIKSLENEQRQQLQRSKIAVPGQGYGGIAPK